MHPLIKLKIEELTADLERGILRVKKNEETLKDIEEVVESPLYKTVLETGVTVSSRAGRLRIVADHISKVAPFLKEFKRRGYKRSLTDMDGLGCEYYLYSKDGERMLVIQLQFPENAKCKMVKVSETTSTYPVFKVVCNGIERSEDEEGSEEDKTPQANHQKT